MPTSEQDDAARLAALLNADSDSDNDEATTVAEQLRTAELLNRPSDAAEDDEDELDHRPPEPLAPEPPTPEPPTAPKLVAVSRRRAGSK